MKSLLRILIIVLFAIGLAIWSPWQRWNFNIANLLGYRSPEQFAGIEVRSLSGEIRVLLDGKELGKATESEAYENSQLEPGSHQLTLAKDSKPEGFYEDITRLINFPAGINVIVAFDLGPSIRFSEGHILTARAKHTTGDVALNIRTLPDDAQVTIDDIAVQTKLLPQLDMSKQHTIKVSRTGYESLQFVILPDSQSDRDDLKKFDLDLEVNLAFVPIDVQSK